MSNEILVKVESVSKKFCRDLKKSLWYGVQDIAGELLGRNGAKAELRSHEFWALRGVSFQLRRGETLGLIGHNGAGKSTLLKLLNGLIKPDKGRITVRGRVGGLLELGTGFNPILTGRENVYTSAALLGIPKRHVDRIMDDIIDFAQLRDFIDTPVLSYSSGMKVRLGFAVAAQLQPDVLLIDEVLAVGDIAFQARCHACLNELKRRGVATIFVSHNLSQLLYFCNRGMLLRQGQVVLDGLINEAVQSYQDQYAVSAVGHTCDSAWVDTLRHTLLGPQVYLADYVESVSVTLEDGRGNELKETKPGTEALITFDLTLKGHYPDVFIGLLFYRSDGMRLAAFNSKVDQITCEDQTNRLKGTVKLPYLPFQSGLYYLVAEAQTRELKIFRKVVAQFRICRDRVLEDDSPVDLGREWNVVPLNK